MSQPTRLILIGKHGKEKSKVGDILLNEKEKFLPSTTSCQLSYTPDNKICVLNTPDLTDVSQFDTELEIGRFLWMSAPGPHAILLVVPFDEFNEEYVKEVEEVIKFLGETLFDFLIVVFPYSGIKIEEKTTSEYFASKVKLLPVNVKTFLAKCKWGGFRIDNESYSKQQVDELLSLVPSIKEGRFFTTIDYENVEKAVQEKTEKIIKHQQRDTTEEQESALANRIQSKSPGQLLQHLAKESHKFDQRCRVQENPPDKLVLYNFSIQIGWFGLFSFWRRVLFRK